MLRMYASLWALMAVSVLPLVLVLLAIVLWS